MDGRGNHEDGKGPQRWGTQIDFNRRSGAGVGMIRAITYRTMQTAEPDKVATCVCL